MVRQRVQLIDSLRGFSLFGILLANLLIFQYGLFGQNLISFYKLSEFDFGSYKFIQIFVEGSFMPIFTFLFGYSLIKLVESLRAKGRKSRWSLVRRFLMLITLGLLHGTFIWEGDILTFYGGIGFFLFIFINRKPKTLIIWGAAILLSMTAISYGKYEENSKEKAITASYVEKTADSYKHGTYLEIKNQRNNGEDPLTTMFDDEPFVLLVIMLFAPIASAPLFLFGMAAAKLNLFANPTSERKSYFKYMVILIPLGLIFKGVAYLAEDSNFASIGLTGGAPMLSLGYIAAFAYLFTSYAHALPFRAFESVGKLSLTNYIMQSVICTSIFYGYGLGWFGDFGTFNSILLGIALFTLQCWISTVYLKKYNRGPLELLVRIVTNFSWNGRVKTSSKGGI
ncbi:DUF418 domain-containing protein [Viridibacillus sp. YIM B01967]|uniref:DUF418 domain-containing protein n=1 Tax=Viridibacillus soli TaxID=2798301 RepID=A0ABS1HCN0_9BACL|nr:DUF418 domain-containing protein [Viridibacillus soli]MBK3497141.1 DUF418 domain-containing protein [Viridibacillus soli]